MIILFWVTWQHLTKNGIKKEKKRKKDLFIDLKIGP
jgi:hypothetical protein